MKLKVICIDNIETDFKNKSIANHYYDLTINKLYDVVAIGISVVRVVDDKGNSYYFPIRLFREMTIEDYRELKLDDLGI